MMPPSRPPIRAVALQMDPVHGINVATDSTYLLGMEAQARGYALYYYTPDRLAYTTSAAGPQVRAFAHPLTFHPDPAQYVTLGAPRWLDLAEEVDVVLMRQDPPFDMAYITATHLLEHIHPRTLVVNDPFHVRNAPEKLLVQYFPDLTPPTLIARDPEAFRAFHAEHQDIVIKPVHGYAGGGVFRIGPDASNLSALLELYAGITREPLIAQPYLPAVREGDTRVVLIDGEIAGAVRRVPPAGDIRANFRHGSTGEEPRWTPRMHEICARVGPELRARGLTLAGLDIIGDSLTEINVTSPTGLPGINRLSGQKLECRFWDAVHALRARTPVP